MTTFRSLNVLLATLGLTLATAAGCTVETTEVPLSADPPAPTGEESSAADRDDAATTLSVLDTVHDRPFDVALWRPVNQDRNHLVVISHGFAGDATSHSPLAEGLAESGYTVAAPTHPDLAGLETGQADLDPLVLRPRHLSLTIDELEEAEGPFESVAVVGHSLGGYGALRIIGATPSDGELDSYCAATSTDPILCDPQARARLDELATRPAAEADPRIDHAVLLAPAYGPLFGADDLADVKAQVLVLQAEFDEEVPAEQVMELVGRLPDGAHSDSVPGGHYIFLRSCTADELAELPEVCNDPDGTDRSTVTEDLIVTVDEFARS